MSGEYTGPAKQAGPAKPAPKRRYTTAHRKGREVVWSNTTEDPEEALTSFIGALATDGHGEHSLRLALQTWAVVLMMGGTGYSRLTPALDGETSISISVT